MIEDISRSVATRFGFWIVRRFGLRGAWYQGDGVRHYVEGRIVNPADPYRLRGTS